MEAIHFVASSHKKRRKKLAPRQEITLLLLPWVRSRIILLDKRRASCGGKGVHGRRTKRKQSFPPLKNISLMKTSTSWQVASTRIISRGDSYCYLALSGVKPISGISIGVLHSFCLFLLIGNPEKCSQPPLNMTTHWCLTLVVL
eukprot:scaffold12161_cov297-Chaetoceros_neogracile.AAC.15